MSVYITNDTDLAKVADAIREKGETADSLRYPNGFVDAIKSIDGSSIPSGGPKIKYIIPVTYKAKRTSDNMGFDTVNFTFTRENINQLFAISLWLMDPTDFTSSGFWAQDITFKLFNQGNYNSVHNLLYSVAGAGKNGNLNPVAKFSNMGKTILTEAFSLGTLTTTSSGYERRGENYKGLIIITDSSYAGKPIVDETKLSQFFNWDAMTEGW